MQGGDRWYPSSIKLLHVLCFSAHSCTAQYAARADLPRLPHQAHCSNHHGMEQLSEYEQERARRILANQTRLGAPVLLNKLVGMAT